MCMHAYVTGAHVMCMHVTGCTREANAELEIKLKNGQKMTNEQQQLRISS